MFRYVAAATALKLFSQNSGTRHLYRALGNRYGGPLRRRRSYVLSHDARSRLLLDLAKRFGVLSGDERLLEIGTGWVHWHSIYHRLFADATVTMFDVWDCRQFGAFQVLFSDLLASLSASDSDNGEAVRRLRDILSSESFSEVYEKLNLRYVADDSGSLRTLDEQRFDCVFSFHVLEHVQNIERLVKEMFDVLRPGGVSIHQIGIDDHLTHYDLKESAKNYIRYSNRTWKWLFENRLQYHNRLQPRDFFKYFEDAGFVLEEKNAELIDETALPPVSQAFQRYSLDDLRCTVLTIVHRKPADQGH